jgi:hypothetical protein
MALGDCYGQGHAVTTTFLALTITEKTAAGINEGGQ